MCYFHAKYLNFALIQAKICHFFFISIYLPVNIIQWLKRKENRETKKIKKRSSIKKAKERRDALKGTNSLYILLKNIGIFFHAILKEKEEFRKIRKYIGTYKRWMKMFMGWNHFWEQINRGGGIYLQNEPPVFHEGELKMVKGARTKRKKGEK